MKFQIRGAEGFNRVYVPFITPRVVDIETNTPASAFPCELFRSVRAMHGEPRKSGLICATEEPMFKSVSIIDSYTNNIQDVTEKNNK